MLQENPPRHLINKAPLHQYLVGEPVELIAIDITGPHTLTEKCNKYIIVIDKNYKTSDI